MDNSSSFVAQNNPTSPYVVAGLRTNTVSVIRPPAPLSGEEQVHNWDQMQHDQATQLKIQQTKEEFKKLCDITDGLISRFKDRDEQKSYEQYCLDEMTQEDRSTRIYPRDKRIKARTRVSDEAKMTRREIWETEVKASNFLSEAYLPLKDELDIRKTRVCSIEDKIQQTEDDDKVLPALDHILHMQASAFDRCQQLNYAKCDEGFEISHLSVEGARKKGQFVDRDRMLRHTKLTASNGRPLVYVARDIFLDPPGKNRRFFFYCEDILGGGSAETKANNQNIEAILRCFHRGCHVGRKFTKATFNSPVRLQEAINAFINHLVRETHDADDQLPTGGGRSWVWICGKQRCDFWTLKKLELKEHLMDAHGVHYYRIDRFGCWVHRKVAHPAA